MSAAHAVGGRIASPGEGNLLSAVPLALRRQRTLFLAVTLAFPFVFNLLLLGAMVLRFGNLPNYVAVEDWFGNVAGIVAGTRSVADMLPIILDEWVIEIGYMNYAFGLGVSEWSLLVMPHKFLMVVMIGALIGVNVALVADQEASGSLWLQTLRSVRSGLVMSVGALAAGLASITLFWIVCHSGPSWVVSLAVLGLDIPTALRLDPMGPALYTAGLTTLTLSTILILRDGRAAAIDAQSRPAVGDASC
jgi:hypothetical protein